MHSNVRTYVGVQGVAAGPIRIGSAGPWIVNSYQLPSAARTAVQIPAIAIQRNLNGTPELLPLRAGLSSTADKNGVVTVEFLQDYYPEHGAPSIDLTAYTTITQFNNLYNIVMGTNTSYTNENCIVVRVSGLENEISTIKTSTLKFEQQLAATTTQSRVNAQEIASIKQQLTSLDINPFEGGALLVAGGANGVEVIV
jgi:hypothetical protein